MTDNNPSDIQSADQFTALCQQLLDRDLSYSDRESLLSDVTSVHYQISFEVARKRNCYSSGPDNLYRDGITLDGKIANLEAAVRVSFKSTDKALLEGISNGDTVSAVVLPDRWSSGLKEWECWAITLITEGAEEDAIAVPAESTDSPTGDTHDNQTADDDTPHDLEETAKEEVIEFDEEIVDTKLPVDDDSKTSVTNRDAASDTIEPEVEIDAEDAEDVPGSEDEITGEPSIPPIQEFSDSQTASTNGLSSEQLEAVIADPPEVKHQDELITETTEGIVDSEGAGRLAPVADHAFDESDPTATHEAGNTQTTSHQGEGEEKEHELVTGFGGCFIIMYSFFSLTILGGGIISPVVMLIVVTPLFFVLRHCLIYRRNFKTLGPERGYTKEYDRDAISVILGV